MVASTRAARRRPEFYDESQATAVNEAADAAVGVARRALREHACAAGAERRSARREVVAYCLRVLDGGDDGAQLKRRELAACAQLGAGVAADLADDVGGSRKDDDSSLRAADAKARKCLDIVDACQRSLDVWDCTSFDLRDDASALKLLQKGGPDVRRKRALGTKCGEDRKTLKVIRGAAGLDFLQSGSTSCRRRHSVAESLKQADAAASKGRRVTRTL